jgi:phosphoribosylformylglycinamidine synthase
MAAAFHLSGMEAWDVNMTDLLSGSVTLDRYDYILYYIIIEITIVFPIYSYLYFLFSYSYFLYSIPYTHRFKGIVLCGGFSYADVNDSAKGWAGVIKFNPKLWAQFEGFKSRSDTFSLGVCNGCQLLALLGWVPFPEGQVSW